MPAPSDPLRYYDLERFLFEDVHSRFARQGWIDAFDFFSIIIWKANRAKSRIAKKLIQSDPLRRTDLEAIVKELTARLAGAPDARQRLRILLLDLGFYLPMASAVLSVLWPDEFTVYDTRVCGQLGDFEKLGTLTRFDDIWEGYRAYVDRVRTASPDLSLRDADRRLWARSASEQLIRDINSEFKRGP